MKILTVVLRMLNCDQDLTRLPNQNLLHSTRYVHNNVVNNVLQLQSMLASIKKKCLLNKDILTVQNIAGSNSIMKIH